MLLASVAIAASNPGGAPSGAAALHVERAVSAARFADSVGINVHLGYHDGPYQNFDRVAALLAQLHVRHLRDGVSLGQDDVCREDRTLAAHGIRFTYHVPPSPQPASLASWAACVGPAIEAYEGINEYDISHPSGDGDWVTTVRDTQRTLYHTVRSDDALSAVRVVGPSLADAGSARSVGDLSGLLDDGNVHDYFAGYQPGTTGYGDNAYGTIRMWLGEARAMAGAKPIISTESGYATPGSPRAVDMATQAAYIPRLFLDHYQAGIARTYDYELVDEGGPPFATYGLVDGNFRPKPAFTALSNLMRVLGNAPSRASGSLAFTLAGADPQLRHALFALGGGRVVLLLWREVQSYDPQQQAAIPVAPRTITVDLAAAPAAASLATFDANGNLQRSTLARRTRYPVTLRDRIAILELTTGSAHG